MASEHLSEDKYSDSTSDGGTSDDLLMILDLSRAKRFLTRHQGILSLESKQWLESPQGSRRENGIERVVMELQDVEFFRRIPCVNEELVKKLQLVACQPQDVLLQVGELENPLQVMYILLSGLVSTRCKKWDSDFDDYWRTKNVLNGEAFGHIDLLYKRSPSIQAIALVYSEALMLKKEDFHLIRNAVELHQSHLVRSLHSTEVLTQFNWTQNEYKALELYSELRIYRDNIEVLDGTRERCDRAYFITKGEGKRVRDIYYKKSLQNRKMCFTAIEPPANEELEPNVIKKRLEYQVLVRSSSFAVGEDLSKDHFFASSYLECVTIPRHFLKSKNSELCERIKAYIIKHLPSDQEIVDSYLEKVNWDKFKKQMAYDIKYKS